MGFEGLYFVKVRWVSGMGKAINIMIVPMMAPMVTFLFGAPTVMPYNWGRQSAQ